MAVIPFILRVFGVDFLPSPEPFLLPIWLHWVIGTVLALPFAILSISVAVGSFSNFQLKQGFLCLFVMIVFPLMTGACINLLLGATIPMLHTAVFGKNGQIEYKMRDFYDGYPPYVVNIGCERGIGVETKVILHSILCGMTLPKDHGLPYNRRAIPRKGAIITVSGRASRTGVFYKSFEARPGPSPE